MKRFFDLYTIIVLTVILLAVIAEILFPPTNWVANWVAIAWMLITAVWVVCARSNQLTAEDWKDLYDWQSRENTRLLERVDDLRKQNSDYAEKCQTTAQGPDNATQKVEELTQTPEAKKPTQKAAKSEYSEQDQARIREEMKSAGMKPKAKKRRPVDDED